MILLLCSPSRKHLNQWDFAQTWNVDHSENRFQLSSRLDLKSLNRVQDFLELCECPSCKHTTANVEISLFLDCFPKVSLVFHIFLWIVYPIYPRLREDMDSWGAIAAGRFHLQSCSGWKLQWFNSSDGLLNWYVYIYICMHTYMTWDDMRWDDMTWHYIAYTHTYTYLYITYIPCLTGMVFLHWKWTSCNMFQLLQEQPPNRLS